jgi:NhaP-type Na+/H+ or K+/H+ antiporter
MTALPEGDIMLAAALIFGLATICQVLAPLLRIPALILLLPVGFLFGVIAPQLRADGILGASFPVVVDLIVAVILFQGGLELGTIALDRKDHNIVRRLVWIGGALSWVTGSLAAHYLLGLAWPLAFLLGAILVVSGPTVVTPILAFVRPTPRVRGILMWEGTLLDPLGAIFAVVVYQVVRATDKAGPLEAIGIVLLSWIVAGAVATAGVLVTVYGKKLAGGNKLLGTQILLVSVIVAAGFSNFLAEGSGLLTALIMGLAMRPVAKRLNTSIDTVVPLFNMMTSIGIGVLFISIAALVPASVIATVALPALGMALIFILITRPIAAAVCTFRTDLPGKERAFIGWMDPRGIVAAATASSLGASLIAAKVSGAEQLLPAAFVIIAVTVFVYGLTSVPVAQALGVRAPADADT